MNDKAVLFAFDDDTSILQTVCSIAESAEYEVHATTHPPELLNRLPELRPSVIVLDLQMPGMEGIEVLRALADRRTSAAVVLLSGDDKRMLASAEAYGISLGLSVAATMRKPLVSEDLYSRLLALHSAPAGLSASDLRSAIVEDEFVVHYQPTINRLDDGSWGIAAMEALLRWQHPRKGLIFPEKFVSIAEECAMGGALTDFVIRRGFEEMQAWRGTEFAPGLRVNVSAGLMADADFPDRLEATLREYDVDPGCLTLELTETATLGQDSEVFDIMTRLRIRNVNLAIDDFGIGYSSLTQLFAMPFNEMKIDKSLVVRIPDSKECSVMVSALVDLAHKLDLSVCAEGVETEQALNFLSSIGCDAAQGFFVSRPVPAAEVRAAIEAWSFGDAAGATAGHRALG